MRPYDIFSMDLPNLDLNTENFTLDYYLEYILYYPEYFITIRPFISPINIYHHESDTLNSNIHNITINNNQFNHNIENINLNSSSFFTHLCNIPILGYIFGKLDNNKMLYVHISGISICPHSRGNHLGCVLLHFFHANGNVTGAYFSELFVRISNSIAIKFYEKSGYQLYRKILGYYIFPHEDALEMRLPLEKDKITRISLLNGKDITSV